MADNQHHSPLQQALNKPLRCFLAALRFLTILPISPAPEDEAQYFHGALYYFPIVGLVIGGIVAGAAFLLGPAPPLVVAAMLAVLLSLLSGFFHLDGLADTADGFMSSRQSDRCLEIMKDSRTGVMGAAALCSVLLLKTAALFSIEAAHLIPVLLVGPVAGRTAMVVFIAFLPSARPSQGLGGLFCNGVSRSAAWLSILFFSGLALLLMPGTFVVITLLCGGLMALFARLCVKKIGGITGDTLGCLCELVETAALIGAAL